MHAASEPAPSPAARRDAAASSAGDGAGGEAVIDLRPHPLYIVLRSVGAIALVLVLALAMAWLGSIGVIRAATTPFLLAGAIALGLLLLWRTADWACRRYTLFRGGPGQGRVEASWGVLRRSTVEAPLDAVRSIVVYQSLRERVFGLGSIGFATAATSGVEVIWRTISRPHDLRERARGEIMRTLSPAPASPAGRMPIIGLAGGIGSGKSELARALGRLGCVVVDSDAEAKAALNLPEVRDQLRQWWGERVLDEDGRVDRHVVASIVFEDPAERRRLEGLVHPIVKSRRAERVAAARAADAPGVVIDAPLLFEAGVDAECDYIVFVDAPHDVRLQRVKGRGWDEAELDRRERSQWPLEKKREASDEVVKNDGPRTDLDEAARRILHGAAMRLAGGPGAKSGRGE